jgi:hypothetical protein
MFGLVRRGGSRFPLSVLLSTYPFGETENEKVINKQNTARNTTRNSAWNSARNLARNTTIGRQLHHLLPSHSSLVTFNF